MNDQNGAPLPDPAAECQRLREIIADMEAQQRQDQQQLKELSGERDQYLRTILDWYGKQFSEEQLQQWATEMEDCKPQTLREVFQELGIPYPEGR